MRSVLKYKIKKFVPERLWFVLAKQNKKKQDFFDPDVKMHYGNKNVGIEIYIIRRRPPGGGLFSNVGHVLQGLIYAESKNMHPVVDMKNYATEYSRIRAFNGTRNAWEYFFQPVSCTSLSEAYESKNVLLSEGERILKNHFMSGRNLSYVLDRDNLQEVHRIYEKYIRLNELSKSYIEYIVLNKEIEEDFTLGVFLRGNDYIKRPATGHPIQPEIENVMNDISKFIDDNPIKKIFLSTDDAEIRKKMRSKFGQLILDDIRSDSNSTFSNHLRRQFHLPSGSISRNISYLSEIYILSKLKYTIAGLSNGSAMMLTINGARFQAGKIYYFGVN